MARVLVTGASRGIGRATVEELARKGHEVIATARSPEVLADLPAAMRLKLDVTDERSVAHAVLEAGPIDVLVNNAGEFFFAPVESSPMDESRRLFELNFFGALRMIQACAPAMRAARSGTIINVSSLVGRMAFPLSGVYSASKFALEGVSESLRFELSHFGVRVVLIEPGVINTGTTDQWRWFVSADDSYGPLAKQFKMDPTTPPQAVAAAVIAAIESPQPPLRWPVGQDAQALLDARSKQGDAAFDATLRGALGLQW